MRTEKDKERDREQNLYATIIIYVCHRLEGYLSLTSHTSEHQFPPATGSAPFVLQYAKYNTILMRVQINYQQLPRVSLRVLQLSLCVHLYICALHVHLFALMHIPQCVIFSFMEYA